jgi:hypothetical protein
MYWQVTIQRFGAVIMAIILMNVVPRHAPGQACPSR